MSDHLTQSALLEREQIALEGHALSLFAKIYVNVRSTASVGCYDIYLVFHGKVCRAKCELLLDTNRRLELAGEFKDLASMLVHGATLKIATANNRPTRMRLLFANGRIPFYASKRTSIYCLTPFLYELSKVELVTP